MITETNCPSVSFSNIFPQVVAGKGLLTEKLYYTASLQLGMATMFWQMEYKQSVMHSS